MDLLTGLFFGSFNPIHNGHLNIARYLLDNGYCREVWFVVSPRNPFKQDDFLLEESRRLDIVQTAIAGDSRMKACDIEFTMPKPSFTLDTLRKLDEMYPEEQFALVIGGDNLRDFDLWRNHEMIAENYRILVYPRPGIELPVVIRKNIILVDAPLFPVSSTEIRRMIQAGENIRPWMPEGLSDKVVENYK